MLGCEDHTLGYDFVDSKKASSWIVCPLYIFICFALHTRVCYTCSLFSAPSKMSQLSPRVADRGTEENMCRKTQKHVRHVCIWGCLSYPVELWSCIHRQDWPLCQWPRTCEHALSLRSTSGGYLLLHCVTCFCVPKFESITVLGRGADKTAREQLEVYEIEKEKSPMRQPNLVIFTQKRNGFFEHMLMQWWSADLVVFLCVYFLSNIELKSSASPVNFFPGSVFVCALLLVCYLFLLYPIL